MTVDSDPYEALTESVTEFIGKNSNKLNIDRSNFAAFEQAILHDMKSDLETPRHSYTIAAGGLNLDSNTMKELKRLQRSLVFVPVDKAGGNFAMVCKSLYVKILSDELKSSHGAYIDAPIQDEKILIQGQRAEWKAHNLFPSSPLQQ